MSTATKYIFIPEVTCWTKISNLWKEKIKPYLIDFLMVVHCLAVLVISGRVPSHLDEETL